MSDDPLKKAAGDAAYRVYIEWQWDQVAARDVTDAIAAAVVEAVEPLIRADERVKFLNSLRTQQEVVDENQRWSDLRAQVERKRRLVQKEIDIASKEPGSFVMVDIGRREALDDVLALIDGGNDGD